MSLTNHTNTRIVEKLSSRSIYASLDGPYNTFKCVGMPLSMPFEALKGLRVPLSRVPLKATILRDHVTCNFNRSVPEQSMTI